MGVVVPNPTATVAQPVARSLADKDRSVTTVVSTPSLATDSSSRSIQRATRSVSRVVPALGFLLILSIVTNIICIRYIYTLSQNKAAPTTQPDLVNEPEKRGTDRTESVREKVPIEIAKNNKISEDTDTGVPKESVRKKAPIEITKNDKKAAETDAGVPKESKKPHIKSPRIALSYDFTPLSPFGEFSWVYYYQRIDDSN